MRSNLKRLLVSIVGLIVSINFTCPKALAEEKKATYLDKVIVSAAKKEATLLNTPSTINIITAEDIELSGQRKVSDVIASIPGVKNDGSGAGTYFNFRGTRSTSSNGPVIYIDGRPLNFGKSNYSAIDDISVDTIERIEVIKAPPASLYGANCSRGVINIITKKGKYAKKPCEVTASQSLGAWQTYKSFTAVTGKKSQWDYNLSAVYEESEGYRNTDPKRTVIDGQLGYEFADGPRFDLYLNWNDSWRKNGPALKHWDLEDRRQNDPFNVSSSGTVYDYRVRPNEKDREILSGGLAFNYDKNDWLLNSSVSLSHFDDIWTKFKYYNNEGNGSTQRGQGVYKEDRDEDKIDFKFSLGRTILDDEALTDTVTFGYDYSFVDWDQTRTYPYATSLTGTRPDKIKKAAIDYERNIHGFFASNEFRYDNWGLLSGLRYDIAEYDVENEVPDSAKKKFKELSWDIAPSYSITPDSNLYFSIGQSYWYPTVGYFTTAMEKDYVENQPEDLKPEEYMNYELGFKHRLAKFFNYSVSLYRSNVDHKYMSCYDDSDKWQGYKHVGSSIHQGVELEADGKPLEWFGYRVGFAWIDAEWDKAETKLYTYGATPADDTYGVTDISGKKVYRVPEYEYTVGFDFYPIEKLIFSLDIHGFGEQYIDALNRHKNKAVTLLDAKLQYSINKNWQVYASGSNIFNVDYESIFNSSGKRYSDGTMANSYYPRDGRYLEIGATLKF